MGRSQLQPLRQLCASSSGAQAGWSTRAAAATSGWWRGDATAGLHDNGGSPAGVGQGISFTARRDCEKRDRPAPAAASSPAATIPCALLAPRPRARPPLPLLGGIHSTAACPEPRPQALAASGPRHLSSWNRFVPTLGGVSHVFEDPWRQLVNLLIAMNVATYAYAQFNRSIVQQMALVRTSPMPCRPPPPLAQPPGTLLSFSLGMRAREGLGVDGAVLMQLGGLGWGLGGTAHHGATAMSRKGCMCSACLCHNTHNRATPLVRGSPLSTTPRLWPTPPPPRPPLAVPPARAAQGGVLQVKLPPPPPALSPLGCVGRHPPWGGPGCMPLRAASQLTHRQAMRVSDVHLRGDGTCSMALTHITPRPPPPLPLPLTHVGGAAAGCCCCC